MTDSKNNTGINNSGDRNSGDRNSGNRNSGDGNSGNRNSGYGNSTNRSSGIFCSKERTIISFDKDSGLLWEQIDHPHFNGFSLTKWIPDSEMTDAEKAANPQFHVRGGYLKKYSYKEAWANFWKDTSQENKSKFLSLPNFDAAIFKEITGIDVNEKQSCAGKIVEIDGKKYKLSEV